MRSAALLVACMIAMPSAAQSIQIHGFLSMRAIEAKAPLSWTAGGYGRFDAGAKEGDERRRATVATAQIGADWMPASWLTIHADGIARHEPSETRGARAGLVQAYADFTTSKWRVRAGNFWLPTSRENTALYWTSPYTITFSALNSWIGQEVRPVGVDVQYSPNFYVTAGATAFGGNDTMGTTLAARGWSLGNRLAVYDEDLPLPGNKTTRAVMHDLDHRAGHSERLRVQLPERAMLQVTHLDNRAELIPKIDGQVPWLTRMNIVSAMAGQTSPTTLAAEWCSGWTAVGFPGGSFRMNFRTYYALLSHKHGADRWSVRYDRFKAGSAKPRVYDQSADHGHAITLAWLRDVGEHLRLGAEYVKANGTRPALNEPGEDPQTGGRSVTLELRVAF